MSGLQMACWMSHANSISDLLGTLLHNCRESCDTGKTASTCTDTGGYFAAHCNRMEKSQFKSSCQVSNKEIKVH